MLTYLIFYMSRIKISTAFYHFLIVGKIQDGDQDDGNFGWRHMPPSGTANHNVIPHLV